MDKNYNIKPKDLAKAKAYWRQKTEARKTPGNCVRCGKPNKSSTHKHCDDCRAYQIRYKARKAGKTTVVNQNALNFLERRIGAVEHSLALLQINARTIYKRGYAKGLKTGKEISHYYGTTPEISKQELAEISHAWDKEIV